LVRSANCGLQHTAGFCVARTRARHCARSLWGGCAASAPHVRARRAARDMVAFRTIQDQCTSERPSRSVQGRAASCQPRPQTHRSLPRGAHVSAPLLSHSYGKRRTRVCRACVPYCMRALYRSGLGHSMHHITSLHQREASLPRFKTLRRASRGLQHTAGFCVARTRARHCARSLSGGGAPRELATRACRIAPVVVSPYLIQRRSTGERYLSFGTRPWCSWLSLG